MEGQGRIQKNGGKTELHRDQYTLTVPWYISYLVQNKHVSTLSS